MDKPPSEPICAQNPQSSSAPRKVGIITHSEQDNVSEVKLYLLNVDLDSCGIDEYTRVLPAVRFQFHPRCCPAICLLNSTVYIFGGYNFDYRTEPEAKSAHKFVLSSEVLAKPNYPVKLGEKTQISLMKYPKSSPASLPTPDGSKIIVFSSWIRIIDSNRAFEIYDPNGDFWEQLPAIPCRVCDSQGWIYGSRCDYCTSDDKVMSYSFMNESHFLIVIAKEDSLPDLVFALDLENRAWVNLRTPGPHYNGGYFVTVKGRYALYSGWAYDFGDGGFFAERDPFERNFVRGGDRAPLSEFAPSDASERGRYQPCCIAPLRRPVVVRGGGGEDEVCDTCVLQFETDRAGKDARVLIDVCRTELTTLDTSVTNCVRLCVALLRCDYGDRFEVRMISI